MASIRCQDCSAAHEARSDCKFCPPCRLLRNLMYCAGKWKRAKKCRTCETKFRPIHARDLAYCATCELRVSKKKQHEVECGLCAKTGAAAQKGVRVCLHCAKDPGITPKTHYAEAPPLKPTGQPKLVGILQRQQDRRKLAHA